MMMMTMNKTLVFLILISLISLISCKKEFKVVDNKNDLNIPKKQTMGAFTTEKKGELPPGHPPIGDSKPQKSTSTEVKIENIKKVKGGYIVSELFSKKSQLSGKKVRVRGKVVKFNSKIMGKNWIHLRDGSGKDGTNDLTITTQASVNVGKTVIAEGKMVYNKDFGSGYKYEVIMEEAKFTVEK